MIPEKYNTRFTSVIAFSQAEIAEHYEQKRDCSNSSQLIFLSKIGRIDILTNLFSKEYIPQAVYRETALTNKKDRVSNILSEKIALGQIEYVRSKKE
ncbi:MAG: hypothetical protein PHE70_00675 [Tepidanaerobacteraceae bacterium]|nr:hypothetical protein [Tepidanaerobacteraceae bacterium]